MGRDYFTEGFSTMGGWGMGFGAIFMIAVVVIFITLAFMLVRAMFNTTTTSTRVTPLEILEERFARGEIDVLEFENRRTELGN